MTHLGSPSVRHRIYGRLAAVREDSKALWGKMSSHQMLCHLSDSFRDSIGARQAGLASAATARNSAKVGQVVNLRRIVNRAKRRVDNPPQAGSLPRRGHSTSGVIQRTTLKWLALYLLVRWPKSVPTRPEVEQGTAGALPGEFQRDRADLIQLVEAFSDPNRSFSWSPHPVFGCMSDREWLRWGYLHADYHLRQFGV